MGLTKPGHDLIHMGIIVVKGKFRKRAVFCRNWNVNMSIPINRIHEGGRPAGGPAGDIDGVRNDSGQHR